MHTHGGVSRAPGDLVLVGVVLPVTDLGEERGGDSEGGGEEPDERDVDGVGPGSGHVLALGPLGVLHKEVPGEEESGQRQEEEEAVVEISGERESVRSVQVLDNLDLNNDQFQPSTFQTFSEKTHL